MNLRKQYAEIAEAHLAGCADHVRERGYAIALACQELADRPPRELTDAEIIEAYAKAAGVSASQLFLNKRVVALRAVIAAFLAKQREPQVVKFRAARSKLDGTPKVFEADSDLEFSIWEWLEPAQEFEVRT